MVINNATSTFEVTEKLSGMIQSFAPNSQNSSLMAHVEGEELVGKRILINLSKGVYTVKPALSAEKVELSVTGSYSYSNYDMALTTFNINPPVLSLAFGGNRNISITTARSGDGGSSIGFFPYTELNAKQYSNGSAEYLTVTNALKSAKVAYFANDITQVTGFEFTAPVGESLGAVGQANFRVTLKTELPAKGMFFTQKIAFVDTHGNVNVLSPGTDVTKGDILINSDGTLEFIARDGGYLVVYREGIKTYAVIAGIGFAVLLVAALALAGKMRYSNRRRKDIGDAKDILKGKEMDKYNW
jgi:hypothetical protein